MQPTWQFTSKHVKDDRPVHFGRFEKDGIQLTFIESVDTLPLIDYQTVFLNLAKWDEYWQQDCCHFVPPNLADFPRQCAQTALDYAEELAMHQRKIARWQTELKKGGEIPAVCFAEPLVNKRTGRCNSSDDSANHLLRIRQGRHRIAYLRQIGMPAFAAAIPIKRMQNIAALGLIDDRF